MKEVYPASNKTCFQTMRCGGKTLQRKDGIMERLRDEKIERWTVGVMRVPAIKADSLIDIRNFN